MSLEEVGHRLRSNSSTVITFVPNFECDCKVCSIQSHLSLHTVLTAPLWGRQDSYETDVPGSSSLLRLPFSWISKKEDPSFPSVWCRIFREDYLGAGMEGWWVPFGPSWETLTAHGQPARLLSASGSCRSTSALCLLALLFLWAAFLHPNNVLLTAGSWVLPTELLWGNGR